MRVHELIETLQKANQSAEVILGTDSPSQKGITILSVYTEHEEIVHDKDGSLSDISPKSLILYIDVGEIELNH